MARASEGTFSPSEFIAASAIAIQLFRAGDDSLKIAGLFGVSEPVVLRMLAAARAREKVLYEQVESVA